MKILVLNGSPHPSGNTKALVDAFSKGAESAGHEVVVCPVGKMNIKGCLGCEYCHTKGEGKCVQKDDMEKVYPELASADMVVFASPVHYFAFSGQLQSAIARFYAQMKPKATKYAMLLSSASPGVYAGIEGQYKSMVGFFEAKDMGIKEVIGDDNKTEATLADIEAFGASIKESIRCIKKTHDYPGDGNPISKEELEVFSENRKNGPRLNWKRAKRN